jgi:8-oxo-dGTP diphosphatase
MKTDLVVAGFIFHGDKVLLIHHKRLDLWLPVGGHIDKDETPDEALVREVKEETNLEVEIINKSTIPFVGNVKKNLALPFHANVHSAGNHDHCCFFYACISKDVSALKTNREILGFKWLSNMELEEKFVPADVRAIAKRAFEVIQTAR